MGMAFGLAATSILDGQKEIKELHRDFALVNQQATVSLMAHAVKTKSLAERIEAATSSLAPCTSAGASSSADVASSPTPVVSLAASSLAADSPIDIGNALTPVSDDSYHRLPEWLTESPLALGDLDESEILS